jgi:hypothetical protein
MMYSIIILVELSNLIGGISSDDGRHNDTHTHTVKHNDKNTHIVHTHREVKQTSTHGFTVMHFKEFKYNSFLVMLEEKISKR